MTKTSSENQWELLCASHGLVCTRVPTASSRGERRPDYEVLGLDGTRFLVEVKEITATRDEAAQISKLNSDLVGEFHAEPGARVRPLIDRANRQLKTLAQGREPGVLVVYNESPFLRHHTEPYAILTAVRGLDVVPVTVPLDPERSPVFHRVRPGPKKRLTSRMNSSISAILIPAATGALFPSFTTIPTLHVRYRGARFQKLTSIISGCSLTSAPGRSLLLSNPHLQQTRP